MVKYIINEFKFKPEFEDRIEHIEILPEKQTQYSELEQQLPENLKLFLDSRGMRLYSHQSEALKALRAGKNVVITTPTASGKTMAFNLPIFECLGKNENATALYLYPTKALSNDQFKTLLELEKESGLKLKPEVYDGDTPQSRRPRIRANSRIIISNPYELHYVLPWHYKWQKFMSSLEFVVLDEAHRYRGVFGSNIAFLIRRLRRICSYYGSNPQFIISTATLANPIEFSENLTGLSYDLVDEDGSPRGSKYFVLYNPYFDGVGTLSTHQETKNLFKFFVKRGLQTICFTISRKMAELIIFWARKELEQSDPELLERITSYRAGYLPEKRREIETKLKEGYLKGITSTNALELGIDIGSLDNVIISGFPGTIISTWQQAGRAGRGTDESMAILVAFHDPLDQYFMKHPKALFEKSHEHAIIDIKNDYILFGHLMCAASELPLDLEKDVVFFGEDFTKMIEALKKAGLISETPNGWVYSGKGRATDLVSLDNVFGDIYKVVCEGRLLETMDKTQAYREAHKEAVLLNQGETYIVEELDLENTLARVVKKDVDYYTQPMKEIDIEIIKQYKSREIGKFRVSYGKVEVSEHYIAYRIMRYDKIVGTGEIDLPPLKFKTVGLWFTVLEYFEDLIWEKRKLDPDIYEKFKAKTERGLKRTVFMGGLHGVEHAMIGIMPFHVMCDRWDIGGVSSIDHPNTKDPTVFIYDGYEGGIGLAEKAYFLVDKIADTALELVRDCKCYDGCPGCIYSPKCGSSNEPLDKKATIAILELLMGLMKES
ncbi:DEAD/DEAH box helicase [bacterium]|nr:DEAD/DEAH box helicase [bacterium]